MANPELVNAVGGGYLGFELDLDELCKSLEGNVIEYEPEVWPGLKIKSEPESPVVLVFRTGKYNIAGAKSIQELHNEKRVFIDKLSEIGITDAKDGFELRNLVFLGRYEKELNLDTLIVALGLENTEYEPEQFPGALYKPPKYQGTFLVFRNGKIILTGAKEQEQAKEEFNDFFCLLDSLFEENFIGQ